MIIQWNSGAEQQLHQGGFAAFNWTGQVAAQAAPTPAIDGSGLRFLRSRRSEPAKLHPEEIERQRRMVDQYLQGLEKKAAPKPAKQARREAKQPPTPVPRLTEAMAQAATEQQIHRVLEATAAEERDRQIAQAEFRRRYWAAFLALAVNDD